MVVMFEAMELVKNIFSNQWIVNIGTGIIAGIFTNWCSKFVFNKTANIEKQNNIRNANKEIIRILKPYVMEKNILSYTTIESIRKDVARECNLLVKDVYGIKEICEKLTREILQTEYLENHKKVEYISFLNSVIEEKTEKAENSDIKNLILLYRKLETNRMQSLKNISTMFIMMISVLVSTIITLINIDMDYSLAIPEPMQITLCVVLTELVVLVSLLNAKNKRKK